MANLDLDFYFRNGLMKMFLPVTLCQWLLFGFESEDQSDQEINGIFF